MTDWRGTNRKVTPVATRDGESYFQQNTRMFVDKELQVRHGMAQSNIPNLGTKIIGMATAWTPNGPIVVQQTQSGGTTTLTGTPNPLPQWGDVTLHKPTGLVGSSLCNAPFMLSGTSDPSGSIVLSLGAGQSISAACCYRVTVMITGTVTWSIATPTVSSYTIFSLRQNDCSGAFFGSDNLSGVITGQSSTFNVTRVGYKCGSVLPAFPLSFTYNTDVFLTSPVYSVTATAQFVPIFNGAPCP